jgi:hypothetical protein
MDEAGDGNGGGGGTPPPAPPALTLDQVNEIVNRAVASAKRDWQKQAPPPVTPPAPKPEDKPEDKLADKALTRQLDEMRQQFDLLKQENERTKKDAEAKDLDSLVRGEIGKFEFAKPGAAEDLFSVLRSRVKRTEEGIFSDDALSLPEFVKKSYDDRPWLSPAKPVGGSGAQGGSRNKSTMDLEQIKPGMSADQRTAAFEAVRRAMEQK